MSAPTPPPLVKINSDSADQIAQLYGIGPALAARIIAYRDTNGPFHSPDDLAQVEGIQPQLAITLSPHVDWTVPIPPEPLKQRSWIAAGVCVCVILPIAYLLFTFSLPNLILALQMSAIANTSNWIRIWGLTAMCATLAFCVVSLIWQAAAQLTTNPAEARSHYRFSIIFVALMTVSAISVIVSAGLWLEFFALGPWSTAFPAISLWLPIGVLIIACFGFFPLILTLILPRLVTNVILRRMYDLSLFIAAPPLMVAAWLYRDSLHPLVV